MRQSKNITGIVRRIDDLGRVVIPKEIRNYLKLIEGEPVEIKQIGDGVLITKTLEKCVCCNETLTEAQANSKFQICDNCIEEIKGL